MDHLGQILQVADLGTTLVTDTTKYLSTLPHPIEVLEELIAVIAVTSNLLTSLNSTLLRFPTLSASLSLKDSFIGPLCEDVKKAFKELEERVAEAKGVRVFEPNDVGLVRLPKNAWCLVMKGEHRAASSRSRLYVEKYRVRVLIDAVCWVGLNRKECLSEEEEEELKVLRDMLPLIAERLVGVQMDYVPRLKAPTGGEEKEFVSVEEKREKPVVTPVEEKVEVVKGFGMPEPSLLKMTRRGKRSIRSSASTDSLASTSSSSSSVTISDDSIQEVWLLRRNEAKKTLKDSATIFGIRWSKHHRHEPASYYVEALPSCASEIKTLRAECRGTYTDAEHQVQLKKKILKMPDHAQREIQTLTESRVKASSNENVKREWEVVEFRERPRRKISPEKGKWWQWRKKGLMDWVVIIKGETVDRKTRVMPSKHEDPWNPKPKQQPALPRVVNPVPAVPLVAATVQARTVLRYVENRKIMTSGEAERKMEEIVSDLFPYKED